MAVTRRLSPASLPCRDLVVSYIIEQGYQFAQGNLILGVGVELLVVLGGGGAQEERVTPELEWPRASI